MRFLLVLSIVLLTGCAITEPKVITEYEYKEVKVPVSNTPMPPDTSCPEDAVKIISTTDAESNPKLAKAYRIAILQLRDCSELKERVLDKYREIAREDKERIDNLDTTPVPNGPFGAGVPTADNAGISSATSIEEEIRMLQIESSFEDLESEFDDLSNKEYDIDEI